MADINALYDDLDGYLHELATKFVDEFIPADPTIPPSDYTHAVKAYCVLAHAAFEEFIEAIVMTVLDHSVDKWIVERKVDDVIIGLLCWYGPQLKIDDDENSAETKPFDYFRPIVIEAKVAFSRYVHQNHGVSILYLRNLLIPVAIEIKQDANLLNSLHQLTEGRGAYAHKGRVKTVLPPEDARRYVKDVLLLCDDIRSQALSKLI